MSKEAAMAIATGQPVTSVNPSLITGDMGKAVSPELSPSTPIEQSPAVKQVLESDRHAALAKKEAKLQREREQAKKEIEEAKLVLKRISDFEEKRKVDPVAALKDAGWTDTEIFNMFTQATADKKEPTPEDLVRQVAQEELGKYKDEQSKLQAEVEKTRNQSLLSSYTNQIAEAFKADPDKFELSNHYEARAREDALFVATEAIKDGGEPLAPKDVAEIVEAMYEGELEKLKTLKKMRAEQASDPANQVKTEPVRTRTLSPQVGAVTESKTLTNKTTATIASRIARNETREQKRERLMDVLRGK